MKNVNTKKYNIMRDGKRTSLTLDTTLANLFCVYLGCDYKSNEANKVVGEGIQKIIDESNHHSLYKSRMVQDIILLKICHDDVRTKFGEYSANNRA